MRCPYCGSEDTRVSDSRPVEENNSIRRRRVCDACKRRFTTYEKIETIPMVVIKKDNNRESYDRSKIEGGILRACHKRPVSINQIKRVVDEIEKEIFDRELLGALPTEDLLLLEEKYILLWSDAEIAETLGIQPNSLRMRLTRAKRRVADALTAQGFRLDDWF